MGEMDTTADAQDAQAQALKPFTITRSTWLRGESGSKLLRSSDSKMCCLGQFLSKIHGVTHSALVDVNTPAGVHKLPGKASDDLLICGTHNRYSTTELMHTNDAIGLEERQRELQIANEFANLGYRVSFED